MQSDYFLGILLAALVSLGFAANRSFGSKALLEIPLGPSIANLLTLFLGAAMTFAGALLTGELGTLSSMNLVVFVIFVSIGIVLFNFSNWLGYIAVKNIGANQVSTLLGTNVVYSFVLGVVFLNEKMNFTLIVGSALIVTAVFLLEASSAANKRKGNVKLGYAASLICALVFGVSPVLIRYGLLIFPYYYAATFLAFLSGTISMIVLKGIRNSSAIIQSLAKIPRSLFVSYFLMAFFLAGAQALRSVALAYAPVVIITPMVATNPVLTFILTRIQARDYESFGARMLISVVIVVVGTAIIAIGLA